MSDISTTRIFTDGEKGITAAKLNDIIASSSIQTAFVSGKPTTSTVNPADNMLVLTSGGAYVQAPFSAVVNSVAAQLPSQDTEIWSVRLRSFNALGNPNFEVDQRNVGGTVPNANAFIIDRWAVSKTGSMVISAGQNTAPLPDICVPGTNFRISRIFLRVTLTTAQASLAANDVIYIQQFCEGSQWRELSNDVHSLSLLVRSSVAGLKFGVALRDPITATKTLTKLCTIPTANVWTLIALPNLPIWPSGNFTGTPGQLGYQISIALAAGGSLTNAANDTWQSANMLGAVGQSNFAASAVNSTFDIAFVQHEPGAVCSTFIDKPFMQNYDECLRYYCKSYDYVTKAGTVTNNGAAIVSPVGLANFGGAWATCPFPKPMAKVPTITGYSSATGTVNTVRDSANGVDRTITSAQSLGDREFGGFNISGQATTGNPYYLFHYTADTGW